MTKVAIAVPDGNRTAVVAAGGVTLKASKLVATTMRAVAADLGHPDTRSFQQVQIDFGLAVGPIRGGATSVGEIRIGDAIFSSGILSETAYWNKAGGGGVLPSILPANLRGDGLSLRDLILAGPVGGW